jgi:hypothetical protein
VHSPRAARLGKAGDPEFVEERLHLEGDAPNVLPRDARPGVEIDAKLVRVLEVARPNGVRMQLDASEIDDPSEPGRVVDDELVGRATRRKRQRRRSKPGGSFFGRPLLIKGLAIGPVDESLEHERPILNAPKGPIGHGEVVADQIELREDCRLRKIHLARAGDVHLPPHERQNRVGLFRRHRAPF